MISSFRDRRKEAAFPAPHISIFMIPLALLFISISLFIVISPGSKGTTITVDDDGEADFQLIQDAIDASENGDAILVYEGIYHENIIVSSSVNITGNGSGTSFIRGDGDGTVVTVNASDVDFRGFHVSGGGSQMLDSGILVRSNMNILSDLNVSGNGYSGILLVDSHENILQGVTCESNGFSGIYLLESHSNSLADCRVSNSANGYLSAFSENNHLYNVISYQNSQYGFKFSNSDSNRMNRSIGWQNGFSIYIDKSDNILVEESLVYQNYYGIFNEEGDHNTILNVNIVDNNLGILLVKSEDCTISTSNLSRNSEAIRLVRSDGNELNQNNFTNNTLGLKVFAGSKHNSALGNRFSGNTVAINASENENETIHARNNYWGNDTGPRHDELNPEGGGDRIAGTIWFDPWLDGNGTPHSMKKSDKDSSNDSDDIVSFFTLLNVFLIILAVLFIWLFVVVKQLDEA